jgi:hypothetical protein
MSALSIQVPFPVFQGRDGQPLENGYVWIGEPNLNPQTNPVVAYYDAALTIPAAQPLRTLNGYISRAGTPAQVYVDGVNFSILVQDSKGSMVYNFPDATGISPDACGVTYDPPFTDSVPYPVCEKLAQYVSVKDFGAVGDGVANDTVAIQTAMNAVENGGELYFPAGTYRIFTKIDVTNATNVKITGAKATILKDPSFDFSSGSNPVFIFRSSTDIEISSLILQGVHSATTGSVFGDDGVFFNSGARFSVHDCRFVNFGDSAVRASTISSPTPPITVDTFDVIVKSNTFDNCLQTSMTPGGAARVIFEGNTFNGMKGAVKFSSRIADAGKIIFSNNIVNGGALNGLEASSVSNLIITNNLFYDIPEIAINIYTNDESGVPANAWGNLLIANNIIRNSSRGVRVSADAYADGTFVLVPNVVISGNTIDTCTSVTAGAVSLLGTIANVRVTNNSISNIAYRAVELSIAGRDALTTTDDIVVAQNTFNQIASQWIHHSISGAALRKTNKLTVSGNTCVSTGGFSIDRVVDFSFEYNVDSQTGSSVIGIPSGTVENARIVGNYIKSSGAGPNTTLVTAGIENNTFDAATSFSFRTDGSSSGLEAWNNRFPNIAPVWNVVPVGYWSLGANTTTTGTAAPTTGTWRRGDVVSNTAPSASGFIGFVCVTAGTPGTWKTFGAISA